MSRRRAIAAVALWAAMCAAACAPQLTSPARDAGDYREKAANAAGAAVSATRTAAALVDLAVRDDATSAYLRTAISDAERDLDGIASSFGGITPPDRRSIALRDELVGLLGDASDDVADARITIRQGGREGLEDTLGRLDEDADALADLEERAS